MKRAFAIVIATLMIASMVLAPLGGVVTTASAQENNSATFESNISVDATPASDGDMVSYEIADDQSVSDPRLELTGNSNTEPQSSQYSAGDGDSISLSVDGSENTDVNFTFSALDGVALQQWDYSIGSDISDTAIDSTSNTVYVAAGSKITALDVQSGGLEWQKTLSVSTVLDVEFDESTDTLYVTSGRQDGATLYALDTASSGAVENTASNFPTGNVDSVAVDSSTVYLGGTNGAVFAADGSSSNFGAIHWSTDVSSYPIYSVTTGANATAVYAQDANGSVVALDKSPTDGGSVSWTKGQAAPTTVTVTSGDQAQTLDVSDYSSLEASLRGANGRSGKNGDNGGSDWERGDSGGSGAVGSVAVDVASLSTVLLTPANGKAGYNDGEAGNGGQRSGSYPDQIGGGAGGDGGGSTAISANSNVLAAAGGGGGGGGGNVNSYDGGDGGNGGGPGGGNGGNGGTSADNDAKPGGDGSIYTTSESMKVSDSTPTSDKIVITSLVPKTQGPVSSCIGNMAYDDDSSQLYSLTSPCGGSSTIERIDTTSGSIAINKTVSGGVDTISSSPASGNAVVGLSNGNAKEVSATEDVWSYESSGVTPASSVSVADDGKWVMLASGQSITGVKANAEADTPSLSLDGHTVTVNQKLGAGETATEQISVGPGDYTGDVSLQDGRVNINAQWTETTETIDPKVTISSDAGSQTIAYPGVLSDSSTVDLSNQVDDSLIGGNVDLTVTASEWVQGPTGQVEMRYGHAAAISESVNYSSESWSERYTLSKTFERDSSDTTLQIPWASDHVGYIRDYNVSINGAAVSRSASTDGEKLVVDVGDVNQGDTVTITATGSKVQAYNGEVRVLEPTLYGEELSTTVEITEVNSDGEFGLRVDGTQSGDRVHYATDKSWSGRPVYTSHTEDGVQVLHTENVTAGSTMTVGTVPLSIRPETGAIEATVEDTEKLIFTLRQGDTAGTGRVNLEFFDTVRGDRYVLWSQEDEMELDADRAQASASFTTDGGTETYSIFQRDGAASTAGPSIAGPVETRDGPPLLLFLGAVGAIIGGTVLARRRFDIKRRTLAIAAIPAIAVATQALTPLSPLTAPLEMSSQLIEMALQGIFQSNVLLVVAVGALLIGLWQLDERTSGSVPWYIRAIIVGLSLVWALETLSPGVILGGLRAGFDSMGPLIVIVLVGGGAYLIREWIQARRAPDTVVQFSAGNEEN